MYVIYGLLSAADYSVRYVGKTLAHRFRNRFNAHLRDAARGANTHKAAWIRSVVASGTAIGMMPLRYASSNAEANRIEREYISVLREAGLDLTNATDGGDGQSPSYRPSERSIALLRAALTGRKQKPEHVAKVAAAHRGRKRSDETRRRISEAKKGKPINRVVTPDYREKLREAGRRPKPYMAALNRTRVWSAESLAKLSASQRARQERERAARNG